MKPVFTAVLFLLVFACGYWLGGHNARHLEQNDSLLTDTPTNHPSTLAGDAKALITASHRKINPPQPTTTTQTPSPPQQEEELWQHAQQAFALEDCNQALSYLQRIEQQQQRSKTHEARHWHMRARCYEKQHKWRTAINAWQQTVRASNDLELIDRALERISNLVAQVYDEPHSETDFDSWLEDILDYLLLQQGRDDPILHWVAAQYYLALGDEYLAQFHALTLMPHEAFQARAQEILAQLGHEHIESEIEIPLIALGKQFLVDVTIDGYPARLLVDTGASLTGLSDHFINQHNDIVNEPRPIQLHTASGTEESYLFSVEQIKLHSLVFDQHIIASFPMSNNGAFDGLLGIDILGRFDFFIDQNRQLLRLKPREVIE